jgi:hypothetical protein
MSCNNIYEQLNDLSFENLEQLAGDKEVIATLDSLNAKVDQLKDDSYELKKETFIVQSELTSLEHVLIDKIRKLKNDFLCDLVKIREGLLSHNATSETKLNEFKTDINNLKKREVVTKEKLQNSGKALTYCEEVIGIKLYNL